MYVPPSKEEAETPKMEPVDIPIRETWGAMEELQRAGLVKSIGVSNFNCQLLRDLLSYADIPPSVLQIESHPRLTQEKLIRFCGERDINVTAFSPLGAESYFSIGMADPSESLLNHQVIVDVAQSVSRTPAQVLLRWGIQRSTAIVPKTSNSDRMAENIALFDFELSDAQMQAISALNRATFARRPSTPLSRFMNERKCLLRGDSKTEVVGKVPPRET